jgi:hypothetical protein
LRAMFNGREKPLMRIGTVLDFDLGPGKLQIRVSCNQ